MDYHDQAMKKTGWSLTTFVVLVALLIAVIAFRHLTSALAFVAVVGIVLAAIHIARRFAARGSHQ